MNTLSAAERRGDTELEHCLKVRHTGNLERSLEAVQKVMDSTNRTFRLSVEAYQALARTKLPIDGLAKYVQEIFDMDSVKDAYRSRVYDGISARYWTGPGGELHGVMGTYWGAWNAVTDWLDHTRGKSEESRLQSSWFGEGRIIRDRALEVALQAVN